MKRLSAAVLALVLAFAATGCSGSSTGPGSAPSIFNLVFFPREFRRGAGGGAVGVSLLFNFKDPDGDLKGYVLSTPTETLQGPLSSNVEGVTTGIAGFPAIVSTATTGDFAYALRVVDTKGNLSNSLAFTVTIR